MESVLNLSYLPDRNSLKENFFDFYAINSMYMPSKTGEDDISNTIEYFKEINIKWWKKQLIQDVYKCIELEGEHITDSVEEDYDQIKQTLIKNKIDPSETLDKIIDRENINKELSVRIYKTLFKELTWDEQYGGKAWYDICLLWERLNQEENMNKIIFLIDRIFDIEHNTNVLLTKLSKYREWIKNALDLKYNVRNVREYEKYSSENVVKLILRYAKDRNVPNVTKFKPRIELQTKIGYENVKEITPREAYEYAKNTIQAPFPKAEDVIATSPQYSYFYARDVLKGPFYKGEESIATSADNSYDYARYVLKGPFPKGEETIIGSSHYAYYYARDIIKGRFPKGEDIIATNPEQSYYYAMNVLQGPFSKGEDIISKDSQYSYYYARDVLKGRFPKGEDAISANTIYAYAYARDIIKGRFPKGEETIAKHPDFEKRYRKLFSNTKPIAS